MKDVPRPTKPLEENRFQAFKVSLCGNQVRRDIQAGLTWEQARSYPLGRQVDAVGPYIWTYSVMGDYPQQVAGLAA
jgi:hypothetical protein